MCWEDITIIDEHWTDEENVMKVTKLCMEVIVFQYEEDYIV